MCHLAVPAMRQPAAEATGLAGDPSREHRSGACGKPHAARYFFNRISRRTLLVAGGFAFTAGDDSQTIVQKLPVLTSATHVQHENFTALSHPTRL